MILVTLLLCPRPLPPEKFFPSGPNLAFAMFRVLFLIEAVAAATCFYPNGDANSDTPCSISNEDSNCCGPGYACL